MSASVDKLYSVADTDGVGELVERSRISLNSPLIAYLAAAAGSIAVWLGVFKLVFG